MPDVKIHPANTHSTPEALHAMALGISFDGSRYAYREFRYDKLPDAVSYAEMDLRRERKSPDPGSRTVWLDRRIPGQSELELMRKYGIAHDGHRYRYLDYRYDRLADAVSFASQSDRHGER